ncbi:bifunctional ADP-dependent NAD(P)H-hydrate dehydratase/NAD(P)H-hydrate epimerase [Gephyromycinifex aptenodytis]|uniref:bifunctional ADP-dependent NAD(P)H-hydrate dehydratase/NAD(P)H-hydrate epimerase n=1 Tax=Gephyromycinifex aptenodytis TaxID=2716227 RepID=UPI0014456AA5|nr:bifunctional ADP-dependent NAD(P)H-hydrate dehydratase/NAD(P)H-hydrate epimerase [Gephyromycinifex aptenodytis]
MTIRAWSVEVVRAAEAAAMKKLPEGELMQRAARGLAEVVMARLQDVPDARVVGLVGSGGNGGDTLYALARLQRKEVAAGVVAVLTSADGAHEAALAQARERGVQVIDAQSEYEQAVAALGEADLVIDGIAGIGGTPGFSAKSAQLLSGLLDSIAEDAYMLAADLPTGADPAGERAHSEGIWADETVAFGVCKPVHLLATAPRCGLLSVIDIGLEMVSTPSVERLGHDDVAALWPLPGPDDDKYTRGVVGIVAGGQSYPGAAVLAVTAAVEAGAGMVRYVGPSHPTSLVQAAVPEAVHGPGRVQAWVVGPGLDPDPSQADEADLAQVAAARAALDSGEPCVVDAGGLALLEGPRAGAGARTLLTPHAGELARLLSRLDGVQLSAADISAEPIRHARRAAQLLHATVLLKGATTYVVPPSENLPVRAQADAPAWLATAGAGDVLAGLAGALLAAGLDPLDAGALASLVHGLSAHQSNPGGPVRALGVAHAIPRTVAQLVQRGLS